MYLSDNNIYEIWYYVWNDISYIEMRGARAKKKTKRQSKRYRVPVDI